jgi:hypothetical protein
VFFAFRYLGTFRHHLLFFCILSLLHLILHDIMTWIVATSNACPKSQNLARKSKHWPNCKLSEALGHNWRNLAIKRCFWENIRALGRPGGAHYCRFNLRSIHASPKTGLDELSHAQILAFLGILG